jgi:hypothetical protein
MVGLDTKGNFESRWIIQHMCITFHVQKMLLLGAAKSARGCREEGSAVLDTYVGRVLDPFWEEDGAEMVYHSNLIEYGLFSCWGTLQLHWNGAGRMSK